MSRKQNTFGKFPKTVEKNFHLKICEYSVYLFKTQQCSHVLLYGTGNEDYRRSLYIRATIAAKVVSQFFPRKVSKSKISLKVASDIPNITYDKENSCKETIILRVGKVRTYRNTFQSQQFCNIKYHYHKPNIKSEQLFQYMIQFFN